MDADCLSQATDKARPMRSDIDDDHQAYQPNHVVNALHVGKCHEAADCAHHRNERSAWVAVCLGQQSALGYRVQAPTLCGRGDPPIP